jgi:hypothetical protein
MLIRERFIMHHDIMRHSASLLENKANWLSISRTGHQSSLERISSIPTTMIFEELFGESSLFLGKAISDLIKAGFDLKELSSFQIDHICYRLDDLASVRNNC